MPGGGGAQAAAPIVLHPLAAVHLPGAVYNYVTAKIMGDLSALREPGGRGGPGGALEAAEIATVVYALTAARGSDDRTREPRIIREAYKETYPVGPPALQHGQGRYGCCSHLGLPRELPEWGTKDHSAAGIREGVR